MKKSGSSSFRRLASRRVATAAAMVGYGFAGAWLADGMALASARRPAGPAGIYTAEQAERGKRAYERECATCHGVDMQGSETAAASLVGSLFREYWGKQTAGALFDTIQMTMPEDDPGRLAEQTVVDLMALLLQQNGVPPGDRELAPDWDALEEIQLVFEPEVPR